MFTFLCVITLFTLIWCVCLYLLLLPLTPMFLKSLWLFFPCFSHRCFFFSISPVSPSSFMVFGQLNWSLQKNLGRTLCDGSGCRMWNDSTTGTASPGPRALNSSRLNPQPFPLGTDQGSRRPTRISAAVKLQKKWRGPWGTERYTLGIIVSALMCELQEKEKCFPGVPAPFKCCDARSVNSNESDLGLTCISLLLTLWETNQ